MARAAHPALNGYKIANPTVLARLPMTSSPSCSTATVTSPISSKATIRETMHQLMAATIDTVVEEIRRHPGRRTPLNGPSRRADAALADDYSAHSQGLDRTQGRRWQPGGRHLARAPGAGHRFRSTNPDHLNILEDWMRSYKPEELFDKDGHADRGTRRTRAQRRPPHGRQSARQRRALLRDLQLPDFRDYAVDVPSPAPLPRNPLASWENSCATS